MRALTSKYISEFSLCNYYKQSLQNSKKNIKILNSEYNSRAFIANMKYKRYYKIQNQKLFQQNNSFLLLNIKI